MSDLTEQGTGRNGRRWILAALLAIVLVLPVLGFWNFSGRWPMLAWQSPADLSMLEWTGAFFNLFLALLLLERLLLALSARDGMMMAGFLSMGILGLFYALSGTAEIGGVWLKLASLLLAAIFFILAIPVGDRRISGRSAVFVYFILPATLLALILGFGLWRYNKLLPNLIVMPDMACDPPLARALFWLCAIMFFGGAVFWLRRHLKFQGGGECLVYAVAMIIFGQMAVANQFIRMWGPLWWLWHAILVFNSFCCCVYLLCILLRDSLLWRLLLSLAFVFGLTVVVTTSIVRGYSDKVFQSMSQRRLLSKHSYMMNNLSYPLKFARSHIRQLAAKAETIIRRDGGTVGLDRQLRRLMTAENGVWPDIVGESGLVWRGQLFCSISGIDNRSYLGSKVRRLSGFRRGKSDMFVTAYLPALINKGWDISVVAALRDAEGRYGGYVYGVVNAAEMRRRSILDEKVFPLGAGRLIFNHDTGEIIGGVAPQNEGGDPDEDFSFEEWREAERSIVSKYAAELPARGRIDTMSFKGRAYLLIASPVPGSELAVVDIVDYGYLPRDGGGNFEYVIAAVGMLALLLGFISLWLMLYLQLFRPLDSIIGATERLERGDFEVRLNSDSRNELGVLARTFDGMVEQLRGVYNDLENTIDERTEALREIERVHQAQKLFFSSVSHELRTPLHGILSFSKFGLDKGGDKRTCEYFGKIKVSGERLLEMISQLLDLAKLETGANALNYSRSSLLMVVLQAYGELQGLFAERKVDFDFKKPEFDTSIDMDTEKIHRVLVNLLSNALKFSPENGVVQVEIKHDERNLTVAVSDCGPGVPPEERESIFEKFVQSGRAETRRQGTGLGLFICRQIIDLHGGVIWVETPSGGGSVFSFSIPRSGPDSDSGG